MDNAEKIELPEITGNRQEGKAIKLSKRAVISAVVVVLLLVIVSYVLTFVLPRGEYQRDERGSLIDGTYQENPELDGITWWQFLLAPLMILSPTVEGSTMIYVIIVLMLVIGAIFTVLDESKILIYLIESMTAKFKNRKYILIFAISFTFMFLGSAVGMFEELIALVPVIVMLCYAMGWDALVGLGISILAASCGFAAGVVNPFSVGVAQTLGGIPLFSGIGPRILTFVLAYIIVTGFIFVYAKRIDKSPSLSPVYALDLVRKKEFSFNIDAFVRDKKKDMAIRWFAWWMIFVVICSIASIFFQPLAEYVMYITVAVYIIGGIGAAVLCGIRGKRLFKLLGKGSLALVPAVLMILVAGGVRYIVTEGDIMDSILYLIIESIRHQNPNTALLLIYAVVFVFEIFVPSGSAKALLIMPIIFDICGVVGVHPQVAVLAFTFADGFSNMFLPTNAGLLLILGLTTVEYPKWIKWSFLILIALLAMTIGVLMLSQNAIYA
ncbi:MAG: hypothetical protein LBF12_07055 [Christensenellaceae bacterium]|jgi:uncharacterized ion transporter superfamily protein YfcC|nr:hypothetical protein [Christensenellaceae bacterium]